MTFATYLINLDRSQERLQKAREQLDALGITFERIPAVDGRELCLDDVPGYNRRAAMDYMGRALVAGEIGCYLSHLECARRFLASEHDHALVLEDDMLIRTDAPQVLDGMLDWLAQRNIDWDVINTGADRLKYTSRLAVLSGAAGSVELIKAHYYPMTTTGLMWSRQGAQRFVQEQTDIFGPIDNILREQQCIADRGLALWPPLVTATGTASDIDGSRTKRNREGRSLLYGWLKHKRVSRNKLRALRHKLAWRSVS